MSISDQLRPQREWPGCAENGHEKGIPARAHWGRPFAPQASRAWLLAFTLIGLGCGGSARETHTPDYNSIHKPTHGSRHRERAPAASATNPFVGAKFYINPEYAARVERTADQSSEAGALYRKVAGFPTAIWVDSIARVRSVQGSLDEAKIQQVRTGQRTLLVFVIYDLPDRDCSAKTSAGELVLAQNGEARYRSEFIDPLATQFSAYPDQSIVAIIEPNALANLATNRGEKKCGKAADAQLKSLAYAIDKLALKNVSVYLDVAHGGWTGTDANRMSLAKTIHDVLEEAGGDDLVRGFATNVSNYNTLSGEDGKRFDRYNPSPDELSYVRKLSDSLKHVGIKHKGFIIDTSRNGRGNVRQKWSSWCNVRGAGLGERPRAIQDNSPVDAYFWIKPPGESDGASDPKQPRFDEDCRSDDAAANAPQAGEWFREYFIDLVRNAAPPL